MLIAENGLSQSFEWETHFGSSQWEYVEGMVTTSDSALMFCGYREDIFGTVGIIGSLDDQGDTLWFKELRWLGKPFSSWSQLEKKPFSSNYLVLGAVTDSGSTNTTRVILELDAFGNVVGSIDSVPRYTYMFPQPDGGFLFLTDAVQAGYSWDIVLSRTDSLGNVLFDIYYNRMNAQSAFDLLPLADGSYIVAASSNEISSSPLGKLFLKLDINGDTIWTYHELVSHGDQSFYASLSPDTMSGYYHSIELRHSGQVLGEKSSYFEDSSKWSLSFSKMQRLAFTNGQNEFIAVEDSSSFQQIYLSSHQQNGARAWRSTPTLSSGLKGISEGIFGVNSDIFVCGAILQQGPPTDVDYYIARFSGVGQEYVPDFCEISPPRAWFGYEYDGQTLTIMDSSFAGLIYHDSVYKYEWFFQGIAVGLDQDSFSTSYDTAVQPKDPEVILVIHNFYRCSDTITRVLQLGTDTVNGIGEVSSYRLMPWPNPASERISVEFPENGGRLIIVDQQGRVMYRESISSSFSSARIASWAPGIYFLRYTLGDRVYTGKIVKN